jgi:hypothetical protein
VQICDLPPIISFGQQAKRRPRTFLDIILQDLQCELTPEFDLISFRNKTQRAYLLPNFGAPLCHAAIPGSMSMPFSRFEMIIFRLIVIAAIEQCITAALCVDFILAFYSRLGRSRDGKVVCGSGHPVELQLLALPSRLPSYQSELRLCWTSWWKCMQ